MFGYILPEKQELKIKEYELFKAYYCGVCKSIGRQSGQLPRMTLTYDSTFLALLLTSIAGEEPQIRFEKCIAHPVKKRGVVVNSQIIDYASDMNIILAYYNLLDNWQDEKSALSGSLMLLLKSSHKKLKSKYYEKCAIIEKRLKDLSKLEKEKCISMDKAAEPFAKLMEEIIAYGPLLINDSYERILRWIGYNIGKWIYILDAYDDIEKDLKRKTYNPLIYQFDYQGEDVEKFKCRIKERVEFNLMFSLSEIGKAYELLDTRQKSSITENIIYMGMLRKTENILNAGSCRKVEKSV